ncbi:MAG: hypothetical protein KKI08_05070, partial [Armatimonadetes bacterium]|nr:hypothetical protein [Armatimonadota bacterium]
ALTGTCPTGGAIVDFVGYGTTDNCYEGAGPTPAPSAINSAQRGASGCTDTDDNSTDFAALAVTPRYSGSPVASCSCVSPTANESGAGAEADYCNLQFPLTISVQASQTTPLIYGRIFETGVTEAAGANPSVQAQVGYGPANINPTTESGWTFVPATFNAQYTNDDEYQATLTAPATAGDYRYTYRFSFDGTIWTYCDMNGAGSNSGLTFETTELPVMTVTP